MPDSIYEYAFSQFNEKKWYSAHDSLEELWYVADGQCRSFLHALIQISVAEYHLENNNLRGSILLMAEGLHHLQGLPSQDLGFDPTVLTLIVAQRLFALQHGLSMSEIPLPMITPPS